VHSARANLAGGFRLRSNVLRQLCSALSNFGLHIIKEQSRRNALPGQAGAIIHAMTPELWRQIEELYLRAVDGLQPRAANNVALLERRGLFRG